MGGLAAAAAAVLVAAVVTMAAGGDHEPSPDSSPIDEAAGRAAARRGCVHFSAFLKIVERNGPAEDARAALDALVEHTATATRLDPSWTQLASGAQALRLGIDEDDREATRIALPLVHDGCQRAR